MSWLTSLFSRNSANSRRAMSSTHEAFSLPVSSPGFHPHPDAFNPEALVTPTTSGSSYSYPPLSNGVYGYVPTGTRSRQSSILPLHSASGTTPGGYPSLQTTWERLRRWLSRQYPELGDTLNYGILYQDMQQVEASLGIPLPPAVRESYLCADGQEAESAAGCSEGLFFGLTLLPLEDVLEEWRFWREVDEDPNTGANPRLRDLMQSIPQGWVRREYSCRGWIPLVADKAGNYLGVDMNPGENGSPGQVIVFGRDFDTKVVMWKGDGPGGWGKWLASFADDLESGEGFELGSTNDSEGSEDSVGYEGYFFDGIGGGQGDTGGDAGTGGLRLTGEYRGWNVLEAWADRSVRRWQDAGLYADESYPPWEKGKAPARESIDLKLAGSGNGSGAEVPIPVLSAIEEEGQTSALAAAPSPLANVTNKASSSARTSGPTIDITKLPAPLPVDLPTPEAIEPFEELPIPEGDLEAGGGMRREVPLTVSKVQPSLSPASPDDVPSPDTIAPILSPSRVLTQSPENHPPPASTSTIPDLLASSSDIIAQSESPDPSRSPESIVDVAHMQDDDPVLIHADDAEIPDTSVRLVDGGGVSGTAVDDTMQSDVVFVENPQLSEPTSVSSKSSNDSTTPGRKHEKKKSMTSSLKKFGPLGNGKRKKDSVVSLKGSG